MQRRVIVNKLSTPILVGGAASSPLSSSPSSVYDDSSSPSSSDPPQQFDDESNNNNYNSAIDIDDDQPQQAQQQQQERTKTQFEILMSRGHILKTYRNSSEVFPGDFTPLPKKQSNDDPETKSSSLLCRSSAPGYSSAPPVHCATNAYRHRTTDAGTTRTIPFLGKAHPNWMPAAGDWCFLCGSYCIGGRDHHLSFDRDHISLNYFFFLVIAMRREWSPRDVLQRSSKVFPSVWERAVAPPIRFSRQLASLQRIVQLGRQGFPSRFVEWPKPRATQECSFHESLSMSVAGHNWLVNRVQKLGPSGAVETHPAPAALSKSSAYTLAHPDSGKILLEQQRLAQESAAAESLQRGAGVDIKKLLASSGILAEAEKRLEQLSTQNLATQFSPAWWMMEELRERQLELQALLAIAMDENADLVGGAVATRAVCAQLPPGLIGQGEKTFRADMMAVISFNNPGAGPNVCAAYFQKAWGRTNLSRCYDALRIEHLHEKVLGKTVSPRQGRSEKSAVLRQLIVELHHAAVRGRMMDDAAGEVDEQDDDDDEIDPMLLYAAYCNDKFLENNNNDGGEQQQMSAAAKRSAILRSAQTAEMTLAKLAEFAVLTQSHVYMDRAWRVAALCGFPTPDTFDDGIDFG